MSVLRATAPPVAAPAYLPHPEHAADRPGVGLPVVTAPPAADTSAARIRPDATMSGAQPEPTPGAGLAPPWHGRALSTPRHLLRLLRPGQWAKNLLVVPLPLLDTPVWQWSTPLRAAAAVVAFILASSLVYVVNDIADRHRDRAHPVKQHRPIAAGAVSVPLAWATAALVGSLLVTLVLLAPSVAWWPLGLYLVVNAAYSARLKHVPLLDVLTVAAGFVLRIVQGYEAVRRPVAGWLVLCVLAVCLMLILGKRRNEILAAGAEHRPALRGYTTHLLDQLLVMCAALTVVTYLLFVRTEAAFEVGALLSAPCALFALFRYLQVVLVQQGGGNPVRTLLRDRLMVGNTVLWGLLLGAPLVTAQLAW